MTEPFTGEIRMMPYTFAPLNWALCDGQSLPIPQNTALFSICGTTYGGDGKTVFNLPDLKGRAPMHAGHPPGGSNYPLGAMTGEAQVTLTQSHLPVHNHRVAGDASDGGENTPAGKVLAQPVVTGRGGAEPKPLYTGAASGTTLDTHAVSMSGGNGAHDNRQPYLALNFCIALTGIYPERS